MSKLFLMDNFQTTFHAISPNGLNLSYFSLIRSQLIKNQLI